MGLFDVVSGAGAVIGAAGEVFGNDKPATQSDTPKYPTEYQPSAGYLGEANRTLSNYSAPQWLGPQVAPVSTATKTYGQMVGNVLASGDPKAITRAQAGMADEAKYQSMPGLSALSPMLKPTFNAYANFANKGMRGMGDINSGIFGKQQADFYMSPYIRNVLEQQEDMANRRFQEQQVARNADYVKSGAFGGSRRAVGDALARRDLDEQLNQINAQGLQAAYDTAMGQFNADRDASIRAKLGVGDINNRYFSSGLSALKGMQGIGEFHNKLRLDAEAARRAASRNRMDALTGLGGLGVTGANLEMDRLGLLRDLGAMYDKRGQAALDADINDYYRRAEFPLSLYSMLYAGMPGPSGSQVVTKPAEQSFLEKFGGALTGLSGLAESEGWFD